MNRAKFFTKIVNPEENYTSHNGESVEIIDFQKGKDIYWDRYTVKFNDGSIASNIMSCELDFDYSLDNKKDEEEQVIWHVPKIKLKTILVVMKA